MNTLGWIGSCLLAACGFPEVIKAYQTGECTLEWAFLLMWFFGEICVLIPVITKIKSRFLIFNYSMNIIFIAILIGYKLWPII